MKAMTCFVYGYGQASFDPAVPSTQSQEAFLKDTCSTLTRAGRLPADAAWAGFVADAAKSKPVMFRQRHEASLLLARLAPGHVVVSCSHDRIFANVVDACETLELANSIGFRLMVLDYGIDTGAPHELLLPLTATMKSLRQREKRRTKDEFDQRKRNGMPAGGKTPIGWELVRAKVGATDRAYFVPNHAARRLATFIAQHYDRWGGNYEQTAYWLNAQKVLRLDGKLWKPAAVRNWYLAAKRGFPLPNGKHQAFPVPASAEPVKHGRYIEPDDGD
jgi:DNA invertase Pin-like site-specific DNA recombinase